MERRETPGGVPVRLHPTDRRPGIPRGDASSVCQKIAKSLNCQKIAKKSRLCVASYSRRASSLTSPPPKEHEDLHRLPHRLDDRRPLPHRRERGRRSHLLLTRRLGQRPRHVEHESLTRVVGVVQSLVHLVNRRAGHHLHVRAYVVRRAQVHRLLRGAHAPDGAAGERGPFNADDVSREQRADEPGVQPQHHLASASVHQQGAVLGVVVVHRDGV
mmetsp:Transcript_8611/g.35289  ORF Transcript_8611/g.35289 Transcript_8611/m.35289 type:complete len:215 (+) Transcript_8611:742-1386(+)